MRDGFLRIACATPPVRVAQPDENAKNIVILAKEAAQNSANMIVFPELCLTAYTCGDLFLQDTLIKAAEKSLEYILSETADLDSLILTGLPVRFHSSLYNCAAVSHRGRLLGLVPKKFIPNYSEFYEIRHFTPGTDEFEMNLCGQTVLCSADTIFVCKTMPEWRVGVEICEDLWTPNPPSTNLALAGATVVANLSASDEVIGKADYRRMLVAATSARLICAYAYTSAGFGESTTDMVFMGHNLIAENGSLLAQSKLGEGGVIYADVDLQKLESERRRANTFKDRTAIRQVYFDAAVRELELRRKFNKTPFVPQDRLRLAERCEDILKMQATGLASRFKHTNAKTAVIGLSGGLDSTLALIVTIHAFDMLGLDRSGIIAVTMPCFGTTRRTKTNAELLAQAYGVSFRDINIGRTVLDHFEDIGQDRDKLDVAFENCQARERTQVLMDIANMTGGLVIGTGDLSELALGWATYNGDHMSMYAVNASIPKTLVRHLCAYEADKSDGNLKKALLDILATPVSPELLPPENGEISQKTEELVGPYELHDFFLYYFVRFGFSPNKIFRLAQIAFGGEYSKDVILRWLKIFIRRFFMQQFKRSCLPDAPKVGTVTLSPRSDWRMPSDASPNEWIANLEKEDK